MPQFDITPNTLDHVLGLEADGHQVTDVSLTMMRPTLYRLRLTLRGGDLRDFFHESATGNEVVCLQEKIAAHIRTYGPRSLLESIYREVSQRARSEGCRPADFTVLLSDDLFRAATPHLPGYRGYGYTFRVATSEPGLWYRIHRVTANEA